MIKETDNELPSDRDYWLSVIGRSLAYQCLGAANLLEKTMAEQAKFLTAIGLKRRDIAMVLDTSEDTIRVTLGKMRKSKRSKDGKGKKKDR